MRKIPEGATHKTVAGGYLKFENSLWHVYCDGYWYRARGESISDLGPLTRIQSEPEWMGEGLPPVGVEIEVRHKDAKPEWARPGFYKDEIVAIGKELVIFSARGNGCETVGRIEDYEFRPVRTPEQIAAEKRDAAIKEMQRLVGSCNTFPFAELYDYGYRLQVEK